MTHTTDMQRRVLITGVSYGLGYSLAQLYLKMGWKVYGVSRNYPDGLQQHSNLYYQSLDLADFNYIPNALQSLLSHVKALDLVILNAGMVSPIGDMRETRIEDLNLVMDVNVWANKLILDTLYAKPIELRQVVAISSGAGITGHRGWNGYAISKAALNMMMQLYAAECPQTHFNAVAPGVADTPMQDYITTIPNIDQFPTLQKLQQAKASGTMPSPDVVADRLVSAFPKLLSTPNGSYADVRKI